MLTPKLEELIWCGEAEWRTWTIGTGNPVLRVGEDETIIVTDIWYNPFIDSRANSVAAPGTAWLSRQNQQFTLSSLNKRYNFVTRAYFTEGQGIQADFQHFDTYCIFTGENISMFIAKFASTDVPWVITPGTAPIGTKAKPQPIGYGETGGGGLQGTNRVDQGLLFNEVRPHYLTPVTPGLRSFDDWQVAFTPASVIQPPATISNQYGNQQFPMITVGYVKINKKLTGQIK